MQSLDPRINRINIEGVGDENNEKTHLITYEVFH